jgi:glycine hydroxymethyltransferase
MYEIADIIATTLQKITPALDKNGNKSKAKYILAEGVKESARKRIHTILRDYVLYPEIDVEFLKKYFM